MGEPKMEGVNKVEKNLKNLDQKTIDQNDKKHNESLKYMNDFLDRAEADPSISIGIFHHEVDENGITNGIPLMETFYEYSPTEKKFISHGSSFSNDKKDFSSFSREQLMDEAFLFDDMVTTVELFENVGKPSKERTAYFTIES